jgi:hypothetical protein
MTPWKTSEIARRLAERDDVEPPQGLLEKIKGEIPPGLPVQLPALYTVPVAARRPPRRRVWLMAASVAAALAGGVLALRVMHTMPPSEAALRKAAQEQVPPRQVPAARPEPPPPSVLVPPAPLQASPATPAGAAAGAPAPPMEVDAAREKKAPAPGFGLKAVGSLSDGREQPVQVPQAPPAPVKPSVAPEPKEQITAVAESPMGGVAAGAPGGAAAAGDTRDEALQRADKEKIASAGENKTGKQEGSAPAPSRRLSKDKPSGDAVSQPTGVKPLGDTERDHLSTFGLDVDTGSYNVVRRYLKDGRLPPPEAVRVEEIVNYFSYGDAPPARGDFAVRAEGAPTPFAPDPGARLLRFNVRGREVRAENRETLRTIAQDAKFQVDFDPAVVSQWRLLGYENRAIAHEQFRDDTVAAGQIGAGQSVTALYEVTLKPGAAGRQRIATLHLRFRAAGTREIREIREIRETTRELRVADLAPSWEKASPGLRLASLVAELAEVLRGSPGAKSVDLDDLARRARQVSAQLAESPQAADILEFVRLVEETARLKHQ